MNPIDKMGVRILRPSEYSSVRKVVPEERVCQLDSLLYSGMRYVELERLHKHPGWYDGYFIHLPRGASLKVNVKQKDRYVRLNDQGRKALAQFLKGEALPSRNDWDYWMKKWAASAGLDPFGMCAKTTRKTWESWLVYYYKSPYFHQIIGSQGHDGTTSLNHYLNMPFRNAEREEMEPFVKGWV